jgi:hypothetical protein
MKRNLFISTLMAILLSQLCFANYIPGLLESKIVDEGFVVNTYAQLPDRIIRMAFGNGGEFGNDLYVVANKGKIYRVTSDGKVDLIATAPDDIAGITFSNPNTEFGDYMYLGSGDGYWSGNKKIYRMDSDGNIEEFFSGSNFIGGTANTINFAPLTSPFSGYLYSQDDNPNRIYKIDSSGSFESFGGDIPFAIDFIFDQWGRFGNCLYVIQSEKSEHGSRADNIWKVQPDGTTTLFLPDALQVHNGGGDITPPISAFGGDIFYINNDWAYGSGGRIYRVTPDGQRIIFAQGFKVHDFSDVVYGPDDSLYVYDGDSSNTIYKISAEGAVVETYIDGPNQVIEGAFIGYRLIGITDKGFEKDITQSCTWTTGDCEFISIDENGVFYCDIALYMNQRCNIYAEYTTGANEVLVAEKEIAILPMCPTGSALEFDGVDDYTIASNNIKAQGGLTLAAWIFYTGNSLGIISSYNANDFPNSSYGLDISGNWCGNSANKLTFLLATGGRLGDRRVMMSDITVPENRWCYVAATWEPGSMHVYINGIQYDGQIYGPSCSLSTAPFSINSQTRPVLIGAEYEKVNWVPYRFFNGQIDEVTIFNRALTAEEVQYNMYHKLAGNEDGLVGYWDLDEGAGDVAHDKSGNGNDGQIVISAFPFDPEDPERLEPNWVTPGAPAICTRPALVKRNLATAIDMKEEATAILDDVLIVEKASLKMLQDIQREKAFDEYKVHQIMRARVLTMQAIIKELWSKSKIASSISDLINALDVLDGQSNIKANEKKETASQLKM